MIEHKKIFDTEYLECLVSQVDQSRYSMDEACEKYISYDLESSDFSIEDYYNLEQNYKVLSERYDRLCRILSEFVVDNFDSILWNLCH